MSLAAPLEGPVSLTLPFTSESAGDARRALVSWMQHHGSPAPVVDDARLVATELVANAIRHADPLGNARILVRWRQVGDDLLLSVYDGGGAALPTLRHPADDSESGRGLAIIDALSLKWSVEWLRGARAVHVYLPLGETTRR